ncbi:MAG TPA: hypothetical protein VMG60_03585 [Burkholderiaceae bacterium]|nr:hypothetical protein [Burkholderiaceae bacterium]
MDEKHAPTRPSRRLLCAFGAASLLAACAAANDPENIVASYGLSVAAQVDVAGPRDAMARCLVERQNVASYPMGIAPGYTATEIHGDTAYVTQWFSLKHGISWATRFALHPVGTGVTQVQVLLPVEQTSSAYYLRAALEVIRRCRLAAAGAS